MSNNHKTTSVLLVDDDDIIRMTIGALIKQLGASVVAEASEGKSGFNLFVKHKPDLVLLDISMPVRDGVDTLRRILQRDASANVIMLTASNDVSIAESCILEGARDFINKASGPSELRERLTKALNS